RDVLAGEPEYRVGGGLAAGTGADHVADVGHQMTLFLQRLDERYGTALAVFLGFERRAFALVLQHGQCMQRDVGTGGGVGGGGEIVGVGFTGDLEDRDGQALGQLGAGSEPFAVGPALHDRLGVRVALFGFFLDVV